MPTLDTEKFLRPDIRIIALDETEYWTLPAKYKEAIKRMEGIYVFDINRVTHCCELTPSYELNFWKNQAIFNDGVTEELQNEIDSWMMEATQEPVQYVHTSSIDKWIETTGKEPFRYCAYGDPLPHLTDDEYRELFEGDDNAQFMQELLAEFNANHPL